MTVTRRITLAFAASTLAVGLAASPSAIAADAMKSAKHKPMKKHKDTMTKTDAMHKDAEPSQ